MAFSVEEFGKMPDGEDVYRYTISNEQGVSASFTDLGAVQYPQKKRGYSIATIPSHILSHIFHFIYFSVYFAVIYP